MPGVNYYLNNEFQQLIEQSFKALKIKIHPLSVINLDTLFELVQLKDVDLNTVSTFVERYEYILENRKKYLLRNPTQDNFVRARASFDEIFSTIMKKDLKYRDVTNRVNLFMEGLQLRTKLLMLFSVFNIVKCRV